MEALSSGNLRYTPVYLNMHFQLLTVCASICGPGKMDDVKKAV